jgi:hypothetical protein
MIQIKVSKHFVRRDFEEAGSDAKLRRDETQVDTSGDLKT